MTIVLAKNETVNYVKLTYVLYDSLERTELFDGSRENKFVDKCDSTIRDKVWLFSSFNSNGWGIYDKIMRELVIPLKDASINYARALVNDVCEFTRGSPDFRALIIDEFSQGGMIEVRDGKPVVCDTFVQYPIEESRYEVERVLRRFDVLSHILNADISGLKDKDIYKGSGLDKLGLREKLKWRLIESLKKSAPKFSDSLIETVFNNNFPRIFRDISNIIFSATGELSVEIKKVLDNIKDPLNRLFDFPLYGKFILASYNNGYLQNFVHNMNTPFIVGPGLKLEGKPELTILILNGQPCFE